jgi:hypothetical protein
MHAELMRRLSPDWYGKTISFRTDPAIRAELRRICGDRPRKPGRRSPSDLLREFLSLRDFERWLRKK